MTTRRMSFLLLMTGSVALYAIDPFVRITDRNLLPSDIFFLASTLLLLLSFKTFIGWERELISYPGFVPFVIYLSAATVGFFLTALRTRSDLEFHFFSALQLGFIVFCLCPTVQSAKSDGRNSHALWTVPIWCVPLAGVLSLTDLLGITTLGTTTDNRQYNVILQANGFVLFAAVSPFLLQRFFPYRPATFWYLFLWGAGCAGTILSGTKAGMICVALSIVFVLWINRRDIFARPRFLVPALMLIAMITGSVAALLSVVPSAFGRFQEMVEFFQAGTDDYSASLRQDQLRAVIEELRAKPVLWLGTGLKQYRVLHPEDELESIHNMYLQQLYETGIVGITALTAIFAMCVRRCIGCYWLARRLHDSIASKYWLCCSFALISYPLMGLVYPLGYDRQFWLLLIMATPSRVEYRELADRVRSYRLAAL